MSKPVGGAAVTDNLLANSAAVMGALLLVDSLHFIFGRMLLAYLPATTSSFFYMAIATVEIAAFAALRRQIDWQLFWRNSKFFLIIGFLIAYATAASFAAVSYIDPGTASMIARVNTLFAVAFGILWLKEKLTRGEKIGAAVAITGVFVISFQPGAPGEQIWLGALLVLSSSFTYALHAAIVKRQGNDIEFTNFFLFRMLASLFFLLIFAVGRGEMVWPQGWPVWGVLFLTGTLNVTISRGLYYIALRRFNLSLLTILLTLSPVITIFWSLLLFGEAPSLPGFAGGAAVICGVIWVTLSRQRKRSR